VVKEKRIDAIISLGFYYSARLIAEGTADSPILFTSTNGTSRQSWNRLYFRSSNNILKNCEVEYGDWAVTFYGYPSTGNKIENCRIHDNDQGIRVERSGFDIKNCEIYDNRHNVVTINNTQVDIEGSKIYDGGRDGIYSLSNNTLNLYGSVIENNGNGGTSSRNGIYTGYNDVINIGDLYYEIWEGYNTIRNNYSSEVYAYSSSYVQIYYNSIHDDDGTKSIMRRATLSLVCLTGGENRRRIPLNFTAAMFISMNSNPSLPGKGKPDRAN
jgi:parallel beta-helix repeat protein